MTYHTKAAFEERMRLRRATVVSPEPLTVFYHIACLPGWQRIVTEQLRLLAHVGVTEVFIGLLGTGHDRDELYDLYHDDRWPFLHCVYSLPEKTEYEHHTLREAWLHAAAHPTGATLYLHTKGASKPDDPLKRQWRRVMQHYVVAAWRENLRRLATADLVGFSWQRSPHLPHFSGNFWLARNDWLLHLPDPRDYRGLYPARDGRFSGQPWWRMHCEAWVGSRPWHHVESPGGFDQVVWTGDRVFSFPTAVEGFDYGD